MAERKKKNTMAQIVRVSRSKGFQRTGVGQAADPNSRSFFRQPLYDRKELAASLSGVVNWFTIGRGSSDTLLVDETSASRTKTIRDTNLTNNGIDTNFDYNLYSVSIDFVPRYLKPTDATNATAIQSILRDTLLIKNSGYVEFSILGKPVLECPLRWIPEANPITSASTTNTGAIVYTGGSVGARSYSLNRHKDPIELPRNSKFEFKVTFDTVTLTQIYDMYVVFDADVSKPR